MSDVLYEEYFSNIDIGDKNDRNRLIYGFKAAAIQHDIENDYLVEIERAVKNLDDIVRQLLNSTTESEAIAS